MTTKEKAKEWAYDEYNNRMGYYAEIGFNKGAEWMLEMACEWIKHFSAHIESFGDRLYGINLEHFIEAMEEE